MTTSRATHETVNQGAAAEVSGIKHALDALLTVATDRALARRFTPSQEGGLRGFIFSECLALFEASEAQRKAADLIRDPIGEAVRVAVRVLGKRLHELGGMDLMTTVLDEVAQLDRANEPRRETIMDRRWDGIGSWAS